MSKRLEEIFSVDRLRRTWVGEAPPPGEEPGSAQPVAGDQPQVAVPGAPVVLGELARLLRLRFPDAKGKPFEPLLSELEEMVMSRFPDDAGLGLPEKERDALNRAIDDLLNRIEDLAEALDLAEQR